MVISRGVAAVIIVLCAFAVCLYAAETEQEAGSAAGPSGEGGVVVTEPNGAPQATKPQPAKPQAAGDKVAVVVNGTAITESQVDAMVKEFVNFGDNDVSPQMLEEVKEKVRPDILQELIAEHLVEEKIEESGLTVSNRDVMAEIDLLLEREKLTRADFKQLLAAYGMSLEEFLQDSDFRKRVLYKKFFERVFADRIEVTDEEVREYYQANMGQFRTPEQVEVSHILISTADIDPNSDRAAALSGRRAEAEEVLEQIKAGADFKQLASVGGPHRRGGALGYISSDTALPEELLAAAFSLEPGQVSDIIRTGFGFHVIKVTGQRPSRLKELEEVKKQIRSELIQQKKQRLTNEYIEQLKAEADIEYPSGQAPQGDSAGEEPGGGE